MHPFIFLVRHQFHFIVDDGAISKGHMETIGLIAAMPQESEAFLRCITKWKRAALDPFRGVCFRLRGRNCQLVTSGIGLKRAMDCTNTLLATTNPHLLISFGIAGAVKDDLQIGDVVVPGNACMLNRGLLDQSRPLASLSKSAWNAASQVLKPDGARLVAGTAITTLGSQDIRQPLEKIAHPILEMETAGIAQVAAENGIPLVSIRGISDGPQAPIPFDLEVVYDEKYNLRIGKILMMVLRSPQIIFQSRQMMRNSRIAADQAARVLVAALSQPAPVTTL
jgi:adenosylhomocysteine nucleosidase